MAVVADVVIARTRCYQEMQTSRIMSDKCTVSHWPRRCGDKRTSQPLPHSSTEELFVNGIHAGMGWVAGTVASRSGGSRNPDSVAIVPLLFRDPSARALGVIAAPTASLQSALPSRAAWRAPEPSARSVVASVKVSPAASAALRTAFIGFRLVACLPSHCV